GVVARGTRRDGGTPAAGRLVRCLLGDLGRGGGRASRPELVLSEAKEGGRSVRGGGRVVGGAETVETKRRRRASRQRKRSAAALASHHCDARGAAKLLATSLISDSASGLTITSATPAFVNVRSSSESVWSVISTMG